MKDAIGQEINVGDKVCHCGGHYADVKIRTVIKLTAKRVSVEKESYDERCPSLDPRTLIVVTSNLRTLAQE